MYAIRSYYAIATATREKSIFTNAKRHFCNGKIYFGMYTFFISGAAPSIDVIEEAVDSETKLNTNTPVK